jgi:hypothetical protein
MFNVNGNPTSATGINNRGAVVVAYTVVNCGRRRSKAVLGGVSKEWSRSRVTRSAALLGPSDNKDRAFQTYDHRGSGAAHNFRLRPVQPELAEIVMISGVPACCSA